MENSEESVDKQAKLGKTRETECVRSFDSFPRYGGIREDNPTNTEEVHAPKKGHQHGLKLFAICPNMGWG